MTELATPPVEREQDVKRISHWIGGQIVAGKSGRSGPVFNPALGQQTGAVDFATRRGGRPRRPDREGRRSSPGAPCRSPSARRSSSRSASSSTSVSEDIARFLTAEHGKVLSDAMGEVARGLEVIEYCCGIPELLKGEFSEQASTGIDVYSIRQPLGVVAGITPFNFPAMVPMWMWAPALACGNTFVLKPSEKDPSASVFTAELLKEAGVPDGVFNVVHGDKVAVDAVIEHPDIQAAVVRRLDADRALRLRERHEARQARPGARRREEPHDRPPGRRHRHGGRRRGERGVRLGGRAVHGDLAGRRGRRCCGSARQGDPASVSRRSRSATASSPTSRWGRSSPGSIATRSRPTSTARANRAQTVVADGRETAPEGDGFFLGVSLLDNVTPEMDAYKDEIFGPVLGVTRVGTYNEAVRLVNENPYGNGTAIFTRDGGVARQFQFDVQAGMVGINVPIPVPVAYYSFGGWKNSLFGDTHIYGPEGINFYTRGKVVTSRWPDPATSKVDLGFPQTR